MSDNTPYRPSAESLSGQSEPHAKERPGLDPGLRWHIEQRIDSYSLCMDDPEYVRACQDAVLDVVARFLAGEDLWAEASS